MSDIKLKADKDELNYFEVTPRVVPADKKSTITIKSLYDNINFNHNKEYKIIYKPRFYTTETLEKKKEREIKVSPQKDVIKIEQYFSQEQEHILILKEIEEGAEKELGVFHIYSLKPDLFARTPYKGDLHLHSCRSDGEGSPAYMAALGRKAGFDFMALTDHRRFTPSIEAQKAYKELSLDYLLLNGEEIHPPDTSNHIVNFGGNFSVSEMFENEEQFKNEVNNLIKELEPIPEGIDEFNYASFVWCCQQIEKGEGLSIFCHPYWITENQHYISDKLTSYLLEEKPFDALEIINGSISLESNNLQVNEYFNYIAHSEAVTEMPLVGVSDAHHCNLGIGYTIVFGKNLSKENIIGSLKDGYSVAVENVAGESIRMYGDPRLVRYAHFLNREIFPVHDKLCLQEGNYMLDYIEEDQKKLEIDNLKMKLDNMYQNYWK